MGWYGKARHSNVGVSDVCLVMIVMTKLKWKMSQLKGNLGKNFSAVHNEVTFRWRRRIVPFISGEWIRQPRLFI